MDQTNEIYEAQVVTEVKHHKGENDAKCINEYEIKDEIGQGSFGKVKRVTRTYFDEDTLKVEKSDYAMKIFNKTCLSNQRTCFYEDNSKQPKMTNMFEFALNEINIWKYLDNPNICKMYQIIDDPEDPKDNIYVVLQLGDLGSIMNYDDSKATFLRNQKVVNYIQSAFNADNLERVAAQIFKQIAKGLQYLHQQFIAHRDLKVDNVVCYTRATKEEAIKLIDFSTSRHYNSNQVMTYDCAGTIGFRAYEQQFNIEEGYNPFIADIWSFGISLFCYVNEEVLIVLKGSYHFGVKANQMLTLGLKKILFRLNRIIQTVFVILSTDAVTKNLLRDLTLILYCYILGYNECIISIIYNEKKISTINCKPQVCEAVFGKQHYERMMVIFFTSVYTISVFLALTFEDTLDQADSDKAQKNLIYLELVILILFSIEIALNVYSTGFKGYFSENWILLDSVIIAASLGLVLFELITINENRSGNITRVIRGIFRFLRIFLLLRKSQQIKRIRIIQTIRTYAEAITDILLDLKYSITDQNDQLDLDWCIKQIAANKIYEIQVADQENKEVATWIQGLNQVKEEEKEPETVTFERSKQRRVTKNRKSIMNAHKLLQFSNKNSTKQVYNNLNNVDQLNFNCFEYAQVAKQNELLHLMVYLFEVNELFTGLNIDSSVFRAFFTEIEKGYLRNPYHNHIHALDVAQTVNFMLKECDFIGLSSLSLLETASMFVAAAIHDYRHPGVNNVYLINTNHKLALTYNGIIPYRLQDRSVLESYHVAESFTLMESESMNIFQNYTEKDYRDSRKYIISMVLATDMAQHFADIARIKSAVQNPDFNIKEKDKLMIMDSIIHASDISNPIKQFEVYKEWTNRILDEFWAQGDKEREQNEKISYLCDRYTTNSAKSQIGFIDFIVEPLFQVLALALPKLQPYLTNLKQNKSQWETLQEYYDNKLRELNDEKEKSRLNESNQLLS